MTPVIFSFLLSFPQDGPQGDVINPECVVDRISPSHFELLLKVEEEGHYVGCVKYQGQRIGPPSFTIICLTGKLQQKRSNHA